MHWLFRFITLSNYLSAKKIIMDISGIFSISGKPGLFKLIAQSRSGVIVEGLDDNKRFHAPATARISGLEDISIYTTEEDMPLAEALGLIYKATDGKALEFTYKDDKNEIITFFEKAIENYDSERVYFSDIKKLLKWYNVLLAAGILNSETKEESKEEEKEATTE